MESIFLRIDPELALSYQRSLLQTEMNLLRIIKRIRAYNELRSKELQMKLLLRNMLKQFSVISGVLKRHLPKADEKDIEETKKMESVDIKTKLKKNELEDELKEIQRKLMKLSQ